MADSWETALQLATGTHVILIGSDDGLIPGCLLTLKEILKVQPDLLISWPQAHYHWPSSPSGKKRNLLQLPLGDGFNLYRSSSQLAKVRVFDAGYESLPMFYNTCVPRSLLEKAREKSGRLFHSSAPDISSGILFACLTESYMRLRFPLTLAGISGSSNGGAHVAMVESGKISEQSSISEFLQLNKSSNLDFHHTLPQLPLVAIIVRDAFIRVEQSLGLPENYSKEEAFNLQCQRETRYIAEPLRSKWCGVLREYFGSFTVSASSDALDDQKLQFGYDPRRRSLTVDLSDFGMVDIADAASMSGKLINPLGLVRQPCFWSSSKPPLLSRIKKSLKSLIASEESWF